MVRRAGGSWDRVGCEMGGRKLGFSGLSLVREKGEGLDRVSDERAGMEGGWAEWLVRGEGGGWDRVGGECGGRRLKSGW